jgi:hypothetical protein
VTFVNTGKARIESPKRTTNRKNRQPGRDPAGRLEAKQRLTPAELKDLKPYGFDKSTPLWYYVLREVARARPVVRALPPTASGGESPHGHLFDAGEHDLRRRRDPDIVHLARIEARQHLLEQ